MATTSDFRNGYTFSYNDQVYKIVEFMHVKPGKGPAFVRTKLKSVQTGKVIDKTFRAGERINEVRLDAKKMQYLYSDDSGYHFMNNETYEQVMIVPEMIDNPQFLKEGGLIDILYHAENEMPLVVELPQSIVVEVTYAEPGVKGDTATNTLKPAKIETGAEIRVPLFINEGDLIKVDTRTGDYIERVKK